MATAKKEEVADTPVEEAANEATIEKSDSEKTTEPTPAADTRAQATHTSYQPYTPPASNDGNGFRNGVIVGAIGAFVLSAIFAFSGTSQEAQIEALQTELTTLKSEYLGLQVNVAEDKVSSLTAQLSNIEAAEAELAAITQEIEATIELLANASASLDSLRDIATANPELAAPVETTEVAQATEVEAEATAPAVEALAEETAVAAPAATVEAAETPVAPE